MKPASEKQIVFANKIFRMTKKPLPEEKTAQKYFYYIQENIEEYNKEKQKIRMKISYTNKFNYNKRVYLDEEEDASWAAAMDFSWM